MISIIGQYFLNHRLDLDEIEWQVEEFARAGYQGIYPHARQGLLTPYMSDDWWRAIDKIAEVCERTGMQMWIWDEDYFPSGQAGGRVVWETPGLLARQLVFTVAEVEGDGPFEVDFDPGHLLRCHAVPMTGEGEYGEPVDVTEYCGTRRQTWKKSWVKHGAYSPMINVVSSPHRRTTMTDNRYALSWRPDQPGRYAIVAGLAQPVTSQPQPDLLIPDGVRRFLELSHQQYHDRYPDKFGALIGGAFTDEPNPGGGLYPWTASFGEQFAADHGYDLLERLAHMALDISDASPAVRHHYRLTQGRLQRENYVEQIADWCDAHGIQMIGHLTRQEWLSLVAVYWPNEIRCYQKMHIPGADPLGAASSWPDAASYHTGLKVVSSAGHLFSRAQVTSDCLAVLGDDAPLRDIKHILDYQMVMGINHFTVHGLNYSLDGPRKDETPPSLFYQHSEWKHMDQVMAHTREMCEALTGGEHLCELAVLYPSTMLGIAARWGANWHDLPQERPVHEVVEALVSHQRDFDFIDEITLAEGVDAHGHTTTPESYRTIVLPHLEYIDADAADALVRFAAAGGRSPTTPTPRNAIGPATVSSSSRPSVPMPSHPFPVSR